MKKREIEIELSGDDLDVGDKEFESFANKVGDLALEEFQGCDGVKVALDAEMVDLAASDTNTIIDTKHLEKAIN